MEGFPVQFFQTHSQVGEKYSVTPLRLSSSLTHAPLQEKQGGTSWNRWQKRGVRTQPVDHGENQLTNLTVPQGVRIDILICD